MSDSKRVLSRASGALDADIMFIGEAPGRLGADGSEIPFHGDKSGHNFEELLKFASISRSRIFVTNAVICNPKDEKGNNSTPTKQEVISCANNLKLQIETIQPKIVVTLGAVALESTKYIESHSLTLKDGVRKSFQWFNRTLVPLYHPGQRAMLHRSFANQRSDYQYLADKLKANYKDRYINTDVKADVLHIVNIILDKNPVISYFSLHKIFYLIELRFFQVEGERLTDAYIIRQKDGPYVTDLHMHKLKNSINNLSFFNKNGILFLKKEFSLFKEIITIENSRIENIVEDILQDCLGKDHAQLKTKVYMTTPMRKILKLEKDNALNLYNTPINFQTVD
ncbi:uracil-DNA glycosylase family protein [Fibrella forsythiae]|uniref:Uracil-DNA glycosylase n=1 Tax=Fibrella forsythiae TaxID=2817061 RepID=A0ABS3JSU3_9BACT|nr:uracil-DNA glycosylase family protein [Fibrella forsythiae]MBO0953076.1 uracil-DNA glycosylase [Fibrella forsythiae]